MSNIVRWKKDDFSKLSKSTRKTISTMQKKTEIWLDHLLKRKWNHLLKKSKTKTVFSCFPFSFAVVLLSNNIKSKIRHYFFLKKKSQNLSTFLSIFKVIFKRQFLKRTSKFFFDDLERKIWIPMTSSSKQCIYVIRLWRHTYFRHTVLFWSFVRE